MNETFYISDFVVINFRVSSCLCIVFQNRWKLVFCYIKSLMPLHHYLKVLFNLQVIFECLFSHFRINGEVSIISSKIDTEPVSKPKLDPEQLPVRPKSVDLDAFVARNSKETGKPEWARLKKNSDGF